jgi:hypothetical protein
VNELRSGKSFILGARICEVDHGILDEIGPAVVN